MTPVARLSAATEVLDKVLAGASAEKTLTNWGRSSRFAGSGDRSAVRDHVFDALRCKRSFSHLGGALTGRGLMLGMLRARGDDPALFFTGERHAPAVLSPPELTPIDAPDPLVALDCPDWLAPQLKASLGADFGPVMTLLQSRASVFLRVHQGRITPDEAQAKLAGEGIQTQPHPLSQTALEVSEGARKIAQSSCYLDGLVELQDAASQAVVDVLPISKGMKLLDYCAGGGGKSLAIAARYGITPFAHDADPGRLKDIAPRAARAQTPITTLTTAELAHRAPYDLVLTDVPCSGSGSWRRAPEAKWALTQDRLTQLCALQAKIMTEAAALVAPGGVLAYATCSLLTCENEDQITAFLHRVPGWSAEAQRRLTPMDGADGFFVSTLRRVN
jgi:16S rRNA (cytosine967-C5)-methyltransferase